MQKNVKRSVSDYFRFKGLPLQPALTFSDVTIKTRYSDIRKRSDLENFRVSLSQTFSLNIPIISANMEDVTDADMAIALARIGGLGFIHQFFPLEERVKEVQRVKRADNFRIHDPLTIISTATLGEARAKMNEHGISSILVVNELKLLCGILTSRDYRFKNKRDDHLPVSKVMCSGQLVTAGPNTTLEEAMEILEKHKIEKLPLVDSRGLVHGLISAKDIEKRILFPHAVRDKNGRLAVGVALRLTADYIEEARQLIEAGADVLLLDTARAGSSIAVEATKKLRRKFPKSVLIVGNIDNPEHVLLLAKAGADCVKVGIGPGARCKTRMVAGVGTPQIYAIAACSAVAKAEGIFVIGDGGIRGSDDFAKALVAGADAVMLGSLLAGTDESPGLLIRKGNQLWKQYRGSASLEHQLERIKKGSLDEIRNPEGESAPIAYAGSVSYVIKNMLDGLRSSMSYVGAKNIHELQEFGEFLWVSNQGYEEGKPRS